MLNFRSFAVLCLILGLTACQTYRNEGSRTPGEFADDVAISTAVKTALVRDAEVKGLAINVEVRRSVVTLYGRVPSTYARNKALKLAGEVRGVAEVVDRLTLVSNE